MPSFTSILGSGLAVDSVVARKLDTNRDGNVDDAELSKASLPELKTLRAEVAADLDAAVEVAERTENRRTWKAWAKGGTAALVGSALFTPFVGIPLGLLWGASDAYGVAIHKYANDAVVTGKRAMNAIDLQIAQKS
jgi:hypothetical protein